MRVRVIREREILGHYYRKGWELDIDDAHLASKLAQAGDVAIISREIVLTPLSVTQTLGKTKS